MALRSPPWPAWRKATGQPVADLARLTTPQHEFKSRPAYLFSAFFVVESLGYAQGEPVERLSMSIKELLQAAGIMGKAGDKLTAQIGSKGYYGEVIVEAEEADTGKIDVEFGPD